MSFIIPTQIKIKSFYQKQQAAINVVKYMKKTYRYGLLLASGDGDQRNAHLDANWVGKPRPGRRPCTGVFMFYGSAAIHFATALQNGITMSSTDAGFIGLSEAT